MSDSDYERFEITDYDLDNEFNINRPRGRQSRHQQIYGIWADDSEEESGGEGGNKRRGRPARKPKDYTMPVNFVAGGIQQSGKKKKKALQADDEKGSQKEGADADQGEQSDDSDASGRPAFGRNVPGSSNSSSEEERPTLGRKQPSTTFQHRSHIASERNVGAWEQHTRGIGAKLLLQMGYEPGKGLGKDLQGISQPVQAHVRKGRGAIGAYGPETAASIGGKTNKSIKVDEDVREAKEFKDQLNKWRKGPAGGAEPMERQGKRYYYKSVEEVIAKGHTSSHLLSEKLSKKLGNVRVIDMTGPERRVLSGYHALGQAKITPEETLYETEATEKGSAPPCVFAMPELTHNLQLLVSQCEQQIIAIDNQERECSSQQAALESEHRKLEEIVQLEQNHIRTLEESLQRVERLSDNPDLSLPQAERLFRELLVDYATEFQEFGLADLAAGVIAPLLKRELVQWQPLVHPTEPLPLIKKWRGMLQQGDAAEQQPRNVFDPYSSLIWAGVMPSFRASAAAWEPKEHPPMAALLDAWAPLLPSWVLDSVLEQLVLPRLVAGVQEWDPLTDTVPIDSWVLPWHAILGSKLEEAVYPQIRSKLGMALRAWSPQDRSARAMLTPWQKAFPEEEMQEFLQRYIVPKLQATLGELIINPLHQDLELWHQVWEWHELIDPMYMAQLLDRHFFPRWMQVLVVWLNQSPDYAEISRWYTGWKSMLSEPLLREPSVKEHLRRALEIMHRASDALLQPTVTPTPPPPVPPAPVIMMDLIHPPAQLEFKELVSQQCADLGIIFAPLPGRREMGKQIYRVGKLFCYIDRHVCMVSDGSFSNWKPVSLNHLLERSQTGIL
ncbi:septin-interacting protein 1 [Drosophila sechellia]|uniref:Septin-interacting protein 1 n=1 Tax=Drosophila sechellia TaxID=7238 RepID=A1XDB1_DROSE|nr:septin-interacting protein 1 [Drosophila sechellia]ABC69936.1 STIP [Drosophila sechellia]EDW54403.1 Sip1-TFIP11 interacting protein [Drosophila sechellia]